MTAPVPPLVPAPRSYSETGAPFFAAVISASADIRFLPALRSFLSDAAAFFGESVLSPGSAAEEYAHAEKYRDEGSELWGGNFRRESAPVLSFAFRHDPSLGEGEYRLDFSPSGILAEASDEDGAFAARATALQLLLLRWDGWRFELPSCRIVDAPAFSWRGLMIDSARHFVSIPSLRRIVTLAALYKLDRLHLHLSDDQGWRMELLNSPRATEAGSSRSGGDPNRNGFYTQTEVRELVAFAADRGVAVVPELDMPGHVEAVLAGDPDLGCSSGPFGVRTAWGVSDDVLCIGNPRSLEFAKAAWDEVCSLFPAPWVHIGGDECPTARWEACPRCAAFKKERGYREWIDLHGHFVAEIADHLAAKGKTVFGWDEVLDSDQPNRAGVIHWRQWLEDRGSVALAGGRDLIRSPFFPYYLDFVQAEDRASAPGLAYKTPRAATLRAVHDFDPLQGLPPDAAAGGPGRGRLLGIQANAWSEFMRDPRRMEYMLFPRLLAIAETAWLGSGRPGWDDFRARLDGPRGGQRRLLDLLGVNYCPLEFSARLEFPGRVAL
ncbi:MAG TPA: hypothetical protein DIC34_02450 [Treponema sp.]|nr:MAG: hypothetical protein A2001_08970 [Treponema sp. GWC1_61_84]HCM25405.1 hypothetical protein [Treponema sp.]